MGEKSPGGSPPVPIRTYLWEEVKRRKAKGGYPWTHLMKPPFDEEEWLKNQDHEYEPINPMPTVPPAAKVMEESPKVSEESPKVEEKARERRFIRIPNTDQIIIPLHGESDEELNPDRYVDQDVAVEELPDPEAAEYRPPSTPTTRTTSRTDGEVNTSQVESSALEHLPLEKSSREPAQRNLGNRIRSSAGRIRTKLRNMPKPRINLPERPKMKLPEKPKFLTERPKFLSERPKFNMPERPKFLRERPKFKMPERPKFNIDTSKITMPKFDFMKKPPPEKKGTSSTRRPLREKSESVRSEAGSKKNLFDSFKYPTYPRFFRRKKKEKGKRASTPPPRMETESSIQSSPASGRNTKWVETYRDIKFADDSPPENKENYSEDENMVTEDPAQFGESYFPEVVRLEDESKLKAKAESTSSVMDSDKEQQSSGSSSARRRAGVLEEIDSDEFFLREKGLSREDVDVSRYLSLEIRDAFRSPKNALARLDNELYFDDYDVDEPELQMHEEPPKAPERKKSEKSLKRSQSKDSAEVQGEEIDERRESDFNTFPMRPSRRKQSESASLGSSQKFIVPIEKPPRKYRSKSSSMQASLRSLPLSDRPAADDDIEIRASPPQPPKRRRSARDLSKKDTEWICDADAEIVPDEVMAQDLEVQRCFESPPVVPSRKTRSRGTSLADEDRTSRGVESIPSEIPADDLPMEELHTEDMEQIDLETEEERPQKEPSPDVDIAGYAVVAKEHKEKVVPPRPPPPPVRHKKPLNTQLRTLKTHGINFFFTYPRRAIRSFQKPPVRPARNYSTLGPSRPPRRNRVFREPVYVDGDGDETKVEAQNVEDTEEKILITEGKEEDDGRDLQSGEVVEKMKGRPLPPPPRPPRKTREDKDKRDEDIDEEVCEICDRDIDERIEAIEAEIQMTEMEIEPRIIPEVAQDVVKTRRDDFFSVFSQIKPPPDLDIEKIEERKVHVEQQTSFDMELPTESLSTPQTTSSTVTEVTVSVQTDPLPDDYVVEETETISLVSESLLTEEIAPHSISPSIEKQLDVSHSEPLSSIPQSEISTKTTSEEKPSKDLKPPSVSEEPQIPSQQSEPSQVIIQQIIPEKIHLSELEVDRLSVNELQARKIVVSDIEGQTMQISELSSKAGNLVVNGLEVPPDILNSIASQIQTKVAETIAESTPQPQLRRVVTPPPPIVVSPSAEIFSLPSPQVPGTSLGTDHIPKPKTTRSKGRKSPTRVIDDSEDELATIMPQWQIEEKEEEETEKQKTSKVSRSKPKAKKPKEEESSLVQEGEDVTEESEKEKVISVPSTSGSSASSEESRHSQLAVLRTPPTSGELLAQLFSIWQTNIADGINQFIVSVNSFFPEGEKRRDAQTAACILLVLIAGLIMLGFGSDNTVHHHHWDYVPPR